MNPLFQKAVTAGASAHSLKAAGDYDGACDRAYYAMFHAARFLLSLERASGESEPKTHQSILREFSEAFVLKGLVSRDIGRGLRRAKGRGQRRIIRSCPQRLRMLRTRSIRWTNYLSLRGLILSAPIG